MALLLLHNGSAFSGRRRFAPGRETPLCLACYKRNALGYEVLRATTESAFWDSYGSRQLALILVDLDGDELVWSKVLEGLGQQGTGEAKVVAFGPHENVALLERAKVLGCDLALSRAEFNRDLLKILLGLGKDSS